MHNDPQDELLSTSQVAALHGVNVSTVNRWVKAGKLPVAVKVPGTTGAHLYRRADVQNLTASDAA